ncbi:MAG TPA: hypothetical protein VIC08_04270 [Cellvibrionaceae bacterium]
MRKFWTSKHLTRQINTLLIAALTSAATMAVELEQLHLPKTYLRYLPQLLDGGRLMASTERCEHFISGQLHLDRSTLEHPVFRYTCRDQENMTYSWVVDGLNYDILDPSRPEGRISFAALQAQIDREREQQRARELAEAAEIVELQQQRQQVLALREQELQRQAEEQARLQEIARRQRLWRDCQTLLQQQTRHMVERVWLTQAQPEAEVLEETKDEQRFRFVIDFNALDPHDTALEYRAYCYFGADSDDMEANIHPRLLELQKSK